ncbi:MAG: phage portal protein [Acidobacteria bacterium]|nr:phage portal protein [Acidobacteriota bacterium]
MKLFGRTILGPRLHEVKQSQSQAVAMMMYVGQEVAWMRKDLSTFATEGYMACVDAYACIDLLAKTISNLPLKLERPAQSAGKEAERIDSHDVLDLIARPNPGQGQTSFLDACVRHVLIAGNLFIEAAGPTTGPPTELYAMKPERVNVLVGSPLDPIWGYRYSVGGNRKDFKRDQVLHLKFFNPDPTDDFYGLAPIQIAAYAIDTSNMTQKWQGRCVKNGFMPAGAFMIEEEKSLEWEAQFNNNIKAATTGEAAGSFLVLTGGKDFKQLSMTPKDADFLGLDKLTTVKICRVFNLSPELIGVPDNKTYANYQESRLALYYDSALPLGQWILDELNNWLMPKFEGRGETRPGERRPKPSLRLAFDLDQVPAIREKRLEMFTKLEPAWWVELNERRKLCGLGDWKNGEGNVLYLPMGLTAIGNNVEEEPEPETPSIVPPVAPVVPGDGEEPPPGDMDEEMPPKSRKAKPGPPELKQFWQKAENKRALWDNFEQRVKTKEKSLLPEVEKFLRTEGKRIAARAAKLPSLGAAFASDLVDAKAMAEGFKRRLYPRFLWMFVHAGNAGLHVAHGKCYTPVEETKGGAFKLTLALKKELSALVLNSGKYIGEETVNKVGSAIAQAQAENWTVQELAQDIAETMGENAATRGRLIARTETAKVENWGEIEGYRQTEFVEKKGWLCAFVEDSREAHMKADTDYAEAIPLDEPFTVDGEELQYPGDPSGSAGNICNCLCTTFPEVAEGGD